MHLPWRDAMEQALYGPSGFFVSGAGPAAHFRTSVHASPVFASALLRLIDQLDGALGFPARFDVVDVGAGRGELLRALSAGVSGEPRSTPVAVVPLAERVRFTAVELAPRPDDLPEHIAWVHEIPANITGLLLATEWLDNVPLNVATHTGDCWRYILVDPTTRAETTGDQVSPEDAEWLDKWWPLPVDGGPDALPPEEELIAAEPVTNGPASTGSGFRAARPAQGSSLTARSRSG
ncbi:SAM-dependent methyltransferase, partial [Micromonospora sonchi]|uniref:SAM-dependent methyltransferase n=1 Tax=Micromonospora sonchi TaxID=1763543 RepID=UPI00166AA3A2